MLDVSRLCEIARNSYCYYNTPIIIDEQTFQIPLIFTGRNGIYVFVEELEVGLYFTQSIGIQEKYLFLFVYEEQDESYMDDNFSLYDFKKKEKIPLINPYAQIEIFYDNHLIPQADLPHFSFPDLESYLYEQVPTVFDETVTDTGDVTYIKPIVPPGEVIRIENKIEELAKQPKLNHKLRIASDGTVEVLKERTKKIGFIDTMYPMGTKWYRCSDRNPDDFYMFTFFGGIIGLHKFADRKIAQGFMYLFTFGMGGVFYVLDLFTMLLGNYSNTQTTYTRDEKGMIQRQQEIVYIRPLEHKVRAVVLLALSIIVAVLAVIFVFKPFMSLIGALLAGLLENFISEDNLQNFINILK